MEEMHIWAHTFTHPESSPGLRGPCHNILMTTLHTQLKLSNTSPICFLNSWYIIHSVTHSDTHTQIHTQCLSLYKYTLEQSSSSSVGSATRAWLILGEVTLYCKHALSAYSFIYYALPSHPACQQYGIGGGVVQVWVMFVCFNLEMLRMIDNLWLTKFTGENFSLWGSFTLFGYQFVFQISGYFVHKIAFSV